MMTTIGVLSKDQTVQRREFIPSIVDSYNDFETLTPGGNNQFKTGVRNKFMSNRLKQEPVGHSLDRAQGTFGMRITD